jgi:hypothetical protein
VKLKIRNTTTDKNFQAPFSLLNIAPKQNNDPIIKKTNPIIIRNSNDSEKT